MSYINSYRNAQIQVADEKKKREEAEKIALQNNLALMGRYLGGVDRYGRQMPMNTGAALGVGLGHILGGALQRWLNRDKPSYDKQEDVNYTPEALGKEAMKRWDAAVDSASPNSRYTYNADTFLPIGDIANGAVIPRNYNLKDEYERNGGILGNLEMRI